MFARMRGRKAQAIWCTLATLGALEGSEASAQILRRPQKPAAVKPSQDQAPPPAFRQSDIPQPGVELTRIPVNPSDAIAVINGEKISRMQLADECVARKGEEILETLIARKLIDQALRKSKLEITPAEVDEEIDRVAETIGHISRDGWLRTLEKERGISPVQYARDIIYPALALRKLAAKSVTVTDKDLKNSFEAAYGDKLRCRLIMVDKLPTARAIWEELRKNPNGFEKLAQTQSMDEGSRSLGGLLAAPITRHAHPQNVSDAAFEQLVDGTPGDTDPTHKPKNGDFTGPIQVAEATWIILKREEVIPAQKIDPKDPAVKKNTYDMIYEVRLKEAMGDYFVNLMKAAAIDNKLTGHTKMANEDQEAAGMVNGDVKLMSDPNTIKTSAGTPAAGTTGKMKLPTPSAASPDVVKQVEGMKATTSK